MGAFPLAVAEDCGRPFGNSSGMPPPQKASMQSTDFKEQERARPSGTHSSEVPLRTRIEYAPKDAPRMDTSFACSSPMQNISGISVEPLLRINAKDDAVEGGDDGERPPSSQPIAPATGLAPPQPAGRIISKYAHQWRAYFEGVGGRWRTDASSYAKATEDKGVGRRGQSTNGRR